MTDRSEYEHLSNKELMEVYESLRIQKDIIHRKHKAILEIISERSNKHDRDVLSNFNSGHDNIRWPGYFGSYKNEEKDR